MDDNPYYLLAYCTALCFLSEFLNAILKPVITLLTQSGKSSFVELRSKISQTKIEMDKLSITDDFAKYIKFQRVINKLQEELKSRVNQQLKYSVKIRYIVTYGVRLIIHVVYVSICWYNWKTSVITLPEDWLQPFSQFLSWPSTVAGGISVPNWILICSVSAKLFSRSINGT